MLIFDAHLDLSMNALEWNRDFTRPISEIREREQGMTDKPDRGRGTVAFPNATRRIGVCVATQIARYVKPGNPRPAGIAGTSVGANAGTARLVSCDGGTRRDETDQDARRIAATREALE